MSKKLLVRSNFVLVQRQFLPILLLLIKYTTKLRGYKNLYSKIRLILLSLVRQFNFITIYTFLAHFPIGKEAIVRTLSVCPSQLLIFRGLTDWGDFWLDRKFMVRGSELWWKKIWWSILDVARRVWRVWSSICSMSKYIFK